MIKVSQTFGNKKGWVTTEKSNNYLWDFDSDDNSIVRIIGVQQTILDAVYPVISVKIMWNTGTKRPTKQINKIFGGEFTKHDKWRDSNWNHEVWSHKNPYTAVEGVRVIQRSFEKTFLKTHFMSMWVEK